MAIYNQNHKAIILAAGQSYNLAQLGNGITASTVHEVFCVSAGTISLTAIGGGTFTWGATAGQSIDIILGGCSVTSGQFVGFKTSYQPNNLGPYYTQK